MATPLSKVGLPTPQVFTGAPIGSMMALPNTGWKHIMDDGSEWLKTGTLVSSIGYKRAAQLEHLRAHMLTQVANPPALPNQLATNGKGTYVMTYGSTSGVLTSTDGGATWNVSTPVASTSPYHSVICVNGLFVIAASNGVSDMRISTSTDGVTWTSRLAVAGTSGMTSSGQFTWTGQLFVLVIFGTSAISTFTSTDGVTWTTRTAGAPGAGSNVAGTGQEIVIAVPTSASAFYSSNGGANWSSITLPTTFTTGVSLFCINGRYCLFSGSTAAYTTKTPATLSSWVLGSPQVAVLIGTNSRHTFSTDYKMLIVPSTFGSGVYAYTTDGLRWSTFDTDAAPYQSAFALGSGDMVFTGIVTLGTWRAKSSFTLPNAVGKRSVIPAYDTNSTNYVRIK